MEKCGTLMNNEQEMKSHQSDQADGSAGVGTCKTLRTASWHLACPLSSCSPRDPPFTLLSDTLT